MIATPVVDETATTNTGAPVALPSSKAPLTARQRLVLLDLAYLSRQDEGESAWVHYRHADVGNRLGITARTVGLALRFLEKAGYVEYLPGRGDEPSMARVISAEPMAHAA